MSLEKSPDRSTTAWNSLLAHRHNDLVQGQIRLLGYQSQQPFHVPLQRRRAPAAQLCSGVSCVIPALQPSHRRTGAQAEAFGRFPPRCSGRDGFDNAFPQVIRIGLRHRFGPPEPRINAARLAHLYKIGNPRFNSAGKRSKLARNPPRQSSVASVTSIETKPAAARRAQYSAMLGSRLARGTWPNSDRIEIGNNISDMASDPPGFSTR